MKLVHACFCTLLVTLGAEAAFGPPAAADNTPTIHRVESNLQHGHVRFAMWYANPARARASVAQFNRADGWTAELLLVPATGAAGTEYQVDGAQMNADALPVFRFHGAAPFTLQCPEATTPMVGRADLTFGQSNVSFD